MLGTDNARILRICSGGTGPRTFGVLFGCHHNRGAPLCRIPVGERGDDALNFEELEFSLQLVSVCEWDSVWCFDAEWLCSFNECDVKFFAIYLFDVTVEYGWELLGRVQYGAGAPFYSCCD